MNRSPAFVTGLSIAALLGVLDIVRLAGLFAEPGPPLGVVVAGAALGIITLAAILPAWRGIRAGMLTIIATRLLSALVSAPIFFVDDAPRWAKVVVAVAIVLAIIGGAFIWAGGRTRTAGRVETGAS